jgi:CubicO group peptidase (beta-lactamase class C family)
MRKPGCDSGALCLIGTGLLWIGVLVAFQACGSNPTEAQSIEITPVPGLQGFEAQLDALRVDLWVPGLAAAIAKDGAIVWSRGFGHANVEQELSATATTPFHLASLTKPFASTILMQLVEEGLVGLDDPASQYGVPVESTGVVTVRHLLTHTSEGTPGSQYSYNGNRFGLLDQVIQSAAGRSFGELLVERILGPLGLSDTAPNPRDPQEFELTGFNRSQFMARMAAGYQRTAGSVVPLAHPSYFGTAAGLVASARDMAAFSLAIDQGMFLDPQTWEAVFTPAVANGGQTLPYGLGWFIHYHEGIKLEWHYGHWTTNSSLIVRAPEKGLTFVVLANTPELSARYGLGGSSDVLQSDVARLFVESFVTGNQPLPGGG